MKLSRLLFVCAIALGLSACGDDEATVIEGMLVGDCSDGADNDGDGKFDCDDDSCSGAPVCDESSAADASRSGFPDAG